MADAIPSRSRPPQEPPLSALLADFWTWCAKNPLSAALLAAVSGTLVYFFGFLTVFQGRTQSLAQWAWAAWGTEAGISQEHSKLVIPIVLFLLWYHREKIRVAPKQGSNLGLVHVGIGILLFVLSVRCLQPRMALAAFPFLVYGAINFFWGRAVARILLFPCVFMIFMIPFAVLEQATNRLQFVITGIIGFLAQIFSIGIQAVGTTLTATDGSFNFEIAEGCSGIRSLLAMAMLTAVYVHLTQREMWKKTVIFCCSVLFAIIGNAGRIFTVILFAKFISPKIAGGIYHDYSGFLFFPIALMAMLGFSQLLNSDLKKLISATDQPHPVDPSEGPKTVAKPKAQYDY